MSQSNQEKFFSTLQPFVALSLISLMTISCGLVGSSDSKNSQGGSASAPTATAEKINPITAKPGETIQVTGKDFSAAGGLKARFTLSDGSLKDVDIAVVSATSASFVMPEGVGLGLRNMKLIQGNTLVETFSLVANTADNSLPILIDDSSEICSTKEYIDRNGDKKTGTKNCAGSAACSQDGQKDCVVAGNYAAAYTTGAASKILSGQTIAGVNGSVANCTAGGSNCFIPSYTMTTQPLKAVSFDAINSSAANIRSTATLGGVPGQLADCTTDGAIGCVTTTSYKSANMTNVVPDNIKSGVTIANVQGSLTTPAPWDVRVGTTVNGITNYGKLKVNCRNRVNTAIYNYDGQIMSGGSIMFNAPNTAVTSGTAIDIWDTIDDLNNYVSGLPPSIVTAWGSNTDCGGVESAAGDDNVWKDVTTAGTGAASCEGSPENCTMQDKITGRSWSKLQASAAWNTAWSNCRGLNYNGQTGWRLPTQKELMEAYTHGIRSAARNNWMTEGDIANLFWSGSSVAGLTDIAWFVGLANGAGNYYLKTNTLQVVCVR